MDGTAPHHRQPLHWFTPAKTKCSPERATWFIWRHHTLIGVSKPRPRPIRAISGMRDPSDGSEWVMGLGFLLEASSRKSKYLKETHCPCLLNSEKDHKIYSWSLLKPEHDLKLVQSLLKLLRALPWSLSKQHTQFYRLLIWLLLCNLASHMETSKAQEKQNTKEMGVAENAFSKCKHRSVYPALGISQIYEVDKYFNGLSLQQNKYLHSVVQGWLKKQTSWILVGLQCHFNLDSSIDWNELLFKVASSSSALTVPFSLSNPV